MRKHDVERLIGFLSCTCIFIIKVDLTPLYGETTVVAKKGAVRDVGMATHGHAGELCGPG